jgi:rod shape-determining protein MreD
VTRYRIPRLAGIGVVALVLEVTALDVFSWGGARPELLLLLACFAALFARDSKQGMIACWTLGLVKDLGSAGPFGWHALLFLAAGALLVAVRQSIYREHAIAQIVVGAAGAAAIGLATSVFVSATAGGIPAGVWIGRLFASVLLTACLAPLVLGGLAGAKFLRGTG